MLVRDFGTVPPKARKDGSGAGSDAITKHGSNAITKHHRVSLKQLADHVGLSPATVSLVMNRSLVADSIPHETNDRILAAARELNYRPNFLARSLRAQRSFTIGVIVPEVSEGYAAAVMSGIEDHLLQKAISIS
jgi:DNA-binding LacI/PurR family transcriptional regulator